ncbi:MAG: hypothetical protein WCF77_00585 [Minisyncoccia bacterium]|jgi:hypothetical protein
MFKEIKKHKLVSGLIAASAAFVLGGFVWAMMSLEKITGPLILHFDDLAGIAAVGGIGTIMFGGVFGIVVVFINGFLAIEFEKRNPLFGKLIAILTLVFAILLFIAFAAILSVN